jgi:site-specific DNA-methyltransferase (adenine-specific)
MHLLINADFQDVSVVGAGGVITDPPYGSTRNYWDSEPVDFIQWAMEATVADASIVTTSDLRFATFLLSRYPNLFSHDLVWAKTVGSGQLNISRRPLRTHENILVFNKGKGFYRRVKEEGEPYKVRRDVKVESCYGRQRGHTAEVVGRDRKTVVNIKNPRVRNGHPTQKPLALWQWLCDSYGRGVVVDPFAGSGVILDVAGFTTVGVEKSDEYYRTARDSRKDRIIEGGPTAEFLELVPNLKDFEHTVFSAKG